MRNIKLTFAYDGTRYAGWQSQPNGRSIQQTIESAIRKITGRRTHVTASGRTDAGVHAKAQVANFRTKSSIPPDNLRMALNTALPRDIVIKRAEEAGPDFNARKCARSKTYRYTIANESFVDPFVRHFAAKCFHRLDISKMRRASKYLVGRRDFRSFKTVDGKKKCSVRTIRRIAIAKKGSMVYIDIEADGFLYNMARAIAGVLVEAGRGKIAPETVRDILKGRDRRHCGPTMPARGLCLIKVGY